MIKAFASHGGPYREREGDIAVFPIDIIGRNRDHVAICSAPRPHVPSNVPLPFTIGGESPIGQLEREARMTVAFGLRE